MFHAKINWEISASSWFYYKDVMTSSLHNSHCPLADTSTWVISKVLHTVYFLFKNEIFYKIHLQAFNVISIVLYHSAPTFEQVLFSCLNAFVVDACDYSGHLSRHLLNASEAFTTEWFLQFWEQVKVWWAQPTRLWLVHLPKRWTAVIKTMEITLKACKCIL
jgi:hypothetical protein